MASHPPPMEMEEEFKCPICMEYLTDPVTLDCGHNYCRQCITMYCETWEELGHLKCPVCRTWIQRGNFRPNWQLANIVELIKRRPLSLRTGDLCVKHKEKLNLFCKEDSELVCFICERSPEHRSHTVILKEEIALGNKASPAASSNNKASAPPSAMASHPPPMAMEQEAKCPICMEYLRDPVSAECGHKYCRCCITNYCETWEELEDLECPVCKGWIQRRNVRSNWKLASIVGKAKLRPLSLRNEDLCAKHKEKLNLFCKEDNELVCFICERSLEHRSHTVILKEEIALGIKASLAASSNNKTSEPPSTMASHPPPMEMEQEAMCPICMEYLTDPVTLDCGHNYCRGCMTNYCETWEELGEDLECPVCRAQIQKGNLRPNWQLANIVEQIKHLPLNPEKGSLCARHKEKLSLFCKEDEELVCWKYKGSPEHKSHTVLPMEEAALEYKLTQVPLSNEKTVETPPALLPIFKNVKQKAKCPKCSKYLTDPVNLGCGHNICRACITYFFKTCKELECPVCRARIQKGNFQRNWQLANIIENIKFLPRNPEKESLCVRHKEKLHLFCKEDEELVCWKCKCSAKHKSHTVLFKEEAAQEYKDMVFHRLETLRKEKSEILECKANVEKETQDLFKHTKAEREKMVTIVSQLRLFLEQQEKRLLIQIADVEMEIAKKKEELLARLSEEVSSLDSIIQEIEEKCQLPASELLQDIRSILLRCKKKKFEKPVSFPPELKWRTWDFRDKALFLGGVTKEFKDKLLFGLQLQKADVTLDPKTAHPRLILSVDYKSVRWREKVQDLPDNPERFDVLPFVLGCEGFTAGRHFWEVSVENERNWAVGVARKSVRRKTMVPFNPERGIWAVGKLTGFGTSSVSSHMSLAEEVKKIRVSLNYEGGQLSFFDADTAALLHLSLASSFSGETLHPFIYILGEAHLILSP